MVAIFVVATIIGFLIIDYFVQRAEKKRVALAPAPSTSTKPRFVIPKGYFFGKGHTWVEVLSNGMARIGVDDFVQRIVGKVDKVTVVPVGSAVRTGDKVFEIKQGTKVMAFHAPISGKLAAFNEDLSSLPNLINKDTYNGGWIAVIQPSDLAADIKKLPIGNDAAQWLREEIKKFRNFISAELSASTAGAPGKLAMGTTLLDGGIPVDSVMRDASQEVWRKFENNFLL